MYNEIDGNMEALRRYEREQDANDVVVASLESNVLPILDEMLSKIQLMIDDAHYYDDYYEGYDFSDTITEMIQSHVIDELDL